MIIGTREKVVAGLVLAACAAAAAHHGARRPDADPCAADPGTYACAVFAQPEWLRRRVYAGRMQVQPAAAAAAELREAGAPDGI